MTSSQRSVERLIHTPAARVSGVLTDVDQHPLIDGSGMVKGRAKGPAPLVLDSRFTMGMAMSGFPYRTTNHVVEYAPDRLIGRGSTPDHMEKAMTATLERLAALVEG